MPLFCRCHCLAGRLQPR